ncbi:MAG TPA: pirin family protein [Rhodanobacteraceae bacterium]|nr:pirin family protein [Rhodanobacteraceae bacterium]
MLELVLDSRRHDLGGFEVGRVLPSRKRHMVGPFIFLDHLGPLDMRGPIPRSSDVRPHPHIGLSTVTYLFDGQMTHRDSLGMDQVIEPGALNWMTSGGGITHSERFDGMRASGGHIEGLQAWVALPEEHERDEPSFDHYDSGELPQFDEGGVSGRIIAGSAFGLESGARTHSPLFYVHADLRRDARLAVPDAAPERAAFIAGGSVELGGQRYTTGQMLVFAAGSAPVLRALEPSRVMLLGGEPVGHRYIWWNFVSSRLDLIEQAKADWQAGRMPLPPADNAEFIPLPDRPMPPPNPMS